MFNWKCATSYIDKQHIVIFNHTQSSSNSAWKSSTHHLFVVRTRLKWGSMCIIIQCDWKKNCANVLWCNDDWWQLALFQHIRSQQLSSWLVTRLHAYACSKTHVHQQKRVRSTRVNPNIREADVRTCIFMHGCWYVCIHVEPVEFGLVSVRTL